MKKTNNLIRLLFVLATFIFFSCTERQPNYSKIGEKIGTIFGQPITGAIAGATVGALAWGGLLSLIAEEND